MFNYIHIPFCRQKCSYCKFALTPIFNDFKKKKYLHFLQKEIEKKLQKFENEAIESIYFGGGTPSILEKEEIAKILSLFSINKTTEISFESNPEDLNKKYLQEIFELGINRLSIGVQSLNNKTLRTIERGENSYIFKALDFLKEIFAENEGKGQKNISINIDFILGLPHAKQGEILQNIQFLHEKYPFITHTSVYILEKGLYPKNWNNLCISDEKINQEYGEICKYFNKKGWDHYELSNFAKPGFECHHNIAYWTHKTSLGFGLSASQFLEKKFLQKGSGKRSANSHSFSNYYKNMAEYEEILNDEQILLEKFLFDLRRGGVKNFSNFGFLNTEKIREFEKQGILNTQNDILHIYEANFPLLDYIMESIIK